MRAELIANEMASAVRFLGGDGSAQEQVSKAARLAKLSRTVIERLRWRKIKRVPADIADMVREAVQSHNEESLARAKHELYVAQQTNALLLQKLDESNSHLSRSAAVEAWRSPSGEGFNAHSAV